ncbi:MAG: desulfoferrodoxin [Candidatus Sabulitectum sp.]|nr:desulfoferrodoxin [Candidatus Sabulitectum sp.]
MAERMQVYKCGICGNIVEVLHGGPGQLVCCNVDMELMEEKTADSTTEKHVPVIEKVEGGYRVKVGSVPHPMADIHYIEWIELVADDIVYRKYLNPGDVAEALFIIDAGNVSAREYCSVHGLWK